MDNDSKENKPLNDMTKSLTILLKEIAYRHPIFILILFSVTGLFAFLFLKFAISIKILLCLIVGILSIAIYFKNKSIIETYLSLFLGLLTVFSITWDIKSALIFTTALISFYFIILFISSIKLSSEMETILTQAANFMEDNEEHSIRYNKLHQLAQKPTKYRQLQLIDRAKSVRFLVFIKVQFEQMEEAIKMIESIKVVYQISLDEALEFFRNVYLLINSLENREVLSWDIERIFKGYNQISLTPSDFMMIFKETNYLISLKKYTFDSYFDELKKLVDTGYDKSKIIERLNIGSP